MATPGITDAQTKLFASNVELKVQTTAARLLSAVDFKDRSGAAAAEVVKQVGSIELLESTGSNGPTQYGDVEHDARWVYPQFFDRSLIIDDQDAVQTIADFKSPYSDTLAAAVARQMERTIANAFFASSKTGKEGGTSTAYPSTAGYVVAVTDGASAATGLNVAKLLAARRRLEAFEAIMDGAEVWCAISALQKEQLMREVNFTSGDYRSGRPLESGQMPNFAGINFIVTEYLPLDSNSYRRCPMWVKSGMHLSRWKQSFEVGKDWTRKNNWAVMAKLFLGATRTQEKKVIEIKCAES